jgi:hypothetical protein
MRQHELDEDIVALLEKMNGVYKLILSTETLNMVEAHRETAQRMCQQTMECTIFMREYTSHGFGKLLMLILVLYLLTLMT